MYGNWFFYVSENSLPPVEEIYVSYCHDDGVDKAFQLLGVRKYELMERDTSMQPDDMH